MYYICTLWIILIQGDLWFKCLDAIVISKSFDFFEHNNFTGILMSLQTIILDKTLYFYYILPLLDFWMTTYVFNFTIHFCFNRVYYSVIQWYSRKCLVHTNFVYIICFKYFYYYSKFDFYKLKYLSISDQTIFFVISYKCIFLFKKV